MDEEVNRNENGEADGMNLEVDSKLQRRGDAYLNERSVIFKEEMVDVNAFKKLRFHRHYMYPSRHNERRELAPLRQTISETTLNDAIADILTLFIFMALPPGLRHVMCEVIT